MKKFSIITLLTGFLFIFLGCDPNYVFTNCDYEYPLDIKNLKDTIKTTDTLWVEHNLDPHLCLYEGVYKNGIAKVSPYFLKLMNDTLIWYYPIVVNYTEKAEVNGETYYTMIIKEQDGRYKSAKYGIVFPDTGIYLLSGFWTELGNGKDKKIRLSPYFNTPSNNIHFLPKQLQEKHNYSLDKPYYYSTYFLAVVE